MVSSGKRVASAAAGSSVRTDRGVSRRGSFARGTCPVCRSTNIALRVSDGKMMAHGKSAASPAGCAGRGQAPYRERKQRPGVLPVADIRPTVAHDQGVEPELHLDVLVERRDDDVPLHLRPPPAGGVA